MSMEDLLEMWRELQAVAASGKCIRCGEPVHPDYFPYCSEVCEQRTEE